MAHTVQLHAPGSVWLIQCGCTLQVLYGSYSAAARSRFCMAHTVRLHAPGSVWLIHAPDSVWLIQCGCTLLVLYGSYSAKVVTNRDVQFNNELPYRSFGRMRRGVSLRLHATRTALLPKWEQLLISQYIKDKDGYTLRNRREGRDMGYGVCKCVRRCVV